jgi:chromosome segregation ATPase
VVKKKPATVKSKIKSVFKPAKKKFIIPPKATLNSIQLTLNKVVDKLSHHDIQFEKIDQRFEKINDRFENIDHRFDKMDQRFEKIEVKLEKMDGQLGKVQMATEHSLSDQIADLRERQDNFSRELRGFEERLINKIDNSVTDLKAAISGHTIKLNNHESRIDPTPFLSHRQIEFLGVLG